MVSRRGIVERDYTRLGDEAQPLTILYLFNIFPCVFLWGSRGICKLAVYYLLICLSFRQLFFLCQIACWFVIFILASFVPTTTSYFVNHLLPVTAHFFGHWRLRGNKGNGERLTSTTTYYYLSAVLEHFLLILFYFEAHLDSGCRGYYYFWIITASTTVLLPLLITYYYYY